MTASVNILRGDLHLALSTAFNRGRYVLMTAGDGQPQEITIDLRERDDDGFDDDEVREALATGQEPSATFGRRYQHPRPTVTPEGEARADMVTDDHGPNSNGDRGTVMEVKDGRVVVQFDTAQGTATMKPCTLDRVDTPPAA